jgi:quercetin dioxygenase-like cupin family protein
MSNQPLVKIGVVKNVYVRSMTFENSGDVELGAAHQFDHATLLASGSVKVTANGKETVFKAPHLIWIKQNVEHTIEALEPNTVCACIHGIRDEEGDIVDPSMIPDGVQYESSAKASLLP